MADNRLGLLRHAIRSVDGAEISVEQTIWKNGKSTYDIFQVFEEHVWSHSHFTDTMTCERCTLLPLDDEDIASACIKDLRPGDSFDHEPTDDEIRQLL